MIRNIILSKIPASSQCPWHWQEAEIELQFGGMRSEGQHGGGENAAAGLSHLAARQGDEVVQQHWKREKKG